MNLYDIAQIEFEIDRIAEANEGEIPDALLQELVAKQTESIVQIEKLCRYIRHLETFGEMCDAEIDRIGRLKTGATNRMKSIKRYLTPYVVARGKFDAGTFRLSTKKSKSVELVDGFVEQLPADIKELYCNKEITYTPDKKKIKDALEKNIGVSGAKLEPHDNLQIK